LTSERDDPRTALVRSLLELAPADAEEAGDRDQIVDFVRRHERPFDRAIGHHLRRRGHVGRNGRSGRRGLSRRRGRRWSR
jgi:hypothetical protein